MVGVGVGGGGGGGLETMYNQITFMFGKDYHGNILCMHLTKFRKLEKRKKNKKLLLTSLQ